MEAPWWLLVSTAGNRNLGTRNHSAVRCSQIPYSIGMHFPAGFLATALYTATLRPVGVLSLPLAQQC